VALVRAQIRTLERVRTELHGESSPCNLLAQISHPALGEGAVDDVEWADEEQNPGAIFGNGFLPKEERKESTIRLQRFFPSRL